MSKHLDCFRMALLAVLLNGTTAMAASLGIAPVGLDLPAKQKAATVSLSNSASSPLSIQVRVFKWQQVDGKDELLPTQDVVASPPATTIPPGQTYIVRVARLTPAPAASEDTYRLVIDEIAPAADDRKVSEGVSMVLRTSMPVFYSPKDATASLQWRVYRDGTELVAEATNKGKRHAKLSDLAVQLAKPKVSFGQGLTGYVLPGAVRRFSIALPQSMRGELPQSGTVTLTGRTDAADLNEQIPFQGQ